jgi:tRNA pseudouridine55 synthase
MTAPGSTSKDSQPGPGGLVVVDKPPGLTSHDVVARVRRLAGTRKVGHAGTLDPMATGVLVVGIERTTRILGHLLIEDKGYTATVRLGVSTDTDDATGLVTARCDASGLDPAAVARAAAALTGPILQVPTQISAVKVDGKRAYKRVRAGEEVELAARPVTVATFDIDAVRPGDGVLDLDVRVECSTGTYVRALARDLGAALGVGGHLTALRRTRVGPYTLADARTLAELEDAFAFMPLDEAAARAFPRRDVDAEAARIVTHGGWLPATGDVGEAPVAIFGPDGTFLALVGERGGKARPIAVFTA